MPGTGLQVGERTERSLHLSGFCLIEADSRKMPGTKERFSLFTRPKLAGNLNTPSLHMHQRGNVEKNRPEKIPFPDRI